MSKFYLNKISVLVVVVLIFSASLPAQALVPNDPDYPKQWPAEKINLPAAWDYTTGSREVVVAVLDTGVQISHPDLINNIWVNMDEIAGDGIDNDRNGYVDDINGYDFVDNDADPSPDFSQLYYPKALTHGTLVAGLIGAQGDNGQGIAGVAWQVRIMPLRVLNNFGDGEFIPTLRAIDYAINNGASIINFSLEGEFTTNGFQEALERAYQSGITIVAAAGNGNSQGIGYDLDGADFYPVCFRTTVEQEMVIGAAATDRSDMLTSFSNYGKKCIDLLAPGEHIYSTEVYRGARNDLDRYYGGWWGGTSFSAPIISGVAALVKSIDKNFTPPEIYKILTTSADPLDEKNPLYAGKIGFGRINAARAVQAAAMLVQAKQSKFPAGEQPNGQLLSGLVSGAPTGALPEIKILNSVGEVKKTFLAYDKKFIGGVNVAAADFTGDAIPEIITAPATSSNQSIKIFKQDGALLKSFWPEKNKNSSGWSVTTADFDGDQQKEIVLTKIQAAGKKIAVKIFSYQGELKKELTLPVGGANFALAVGDINADGKAELAVASALNKQISIKFFSWQGKLIKESSIFINDQKIVGGLGLALGDLNNDHQVEMALSINGRLKILNLAGVERLSVVAEAKAGNKRWWRLTIGDYNYDGWLEILATPNSPELSARIIDGEGELLREVPIFSSNSKLSVNLGIIN